MSSLLASNLVHGVHMRGSFQVTRAALPHMRRQAYGRLIMTSSVAGIYGNYGQANYSSAKLGLHGLAQTVAREGDKYNIHCNTVAPMGGTRLTEDILPQDLYSGLKPELIAPLVAYLCHEDCNENGGLFEAAGGWFGKYRWERSQGAVCRGSLKELVSPEAVQSKWKSITSFEGALHPTSNQEAAGLLAGVLQNLYENDEQQQQQQHTPEQQQQNSSKPLLQQKQQHQQQQRSFSTAAPTSATGPGSVVGFKQDPVPFTYTSRDVILYALGVGVSTSDSDGLQFLYEGSTNFSMIPTFMIMASQTSVMEGKLMSGECEGYIPNLPKLVHAEQHLEIYKPLPPYGTTLYSSLEVEDVLDKRNGAMLVLRVNISNEAKEDVASTQWILYVVGDGKFGGRRNNPCVVPLVSPPDTEPEATVSCTTTIDQAALYRMSGDLNPLHVDPSFAAIGGFSRPILHGLCSLGVACRAVVSTYCGGDPSKIRAVKTRFAKPVLPGETLLTEMWKQGSRVLFRCKVKESGVACLTGGYVDLMEEEQNDSTTKDAEVTMPEKTLIIYENLKKRVLTEGPMLVKKVRGVFQFNITVNKVQVAQFSVDLRAPPGIVYPGPYRGGSPDVSLTLDEEALVKLDQGVITAQKAFMASLLEVEGNMMMSQRLSELIGVQNSKL